MARAVCVRGRAAPARVARRQRDTRCSAGAVEILAGGAALGAGLFLLQAGADARPSEASAAAGAAPAPPPPPPRQDATQSKQQQASSAEGTGGVAARGKAAVGSASDVGGRDIMEDSLDVRADGRCGYLYAAVFDGHGGSASSQFLQVSLYDALSAAIDADDREEVSPSAPAGDALASPLALKAPLEQAFANADRELLKYLSSLGEPECWSGSTATAVLVRDDRIIVANVGDSRAVLCRGGQAVPLSTEHRPIESYRDGKREVERVEASGGWVRQGRVCGILAVSRAFGDVDFKDDREYLLEELREAGEKEAAGKTFTGPLVVAQPDVTEVARQPKDQFIIVATDGLWDCCSSSQAVQYIRQQLAKHGSVQKAADALVYTAVHSWRTSDNIAVTIVDLQTGEEGSA